MGRPPKLSGDLVSVSVHGKGAAWCDGVFAGDRDILDAARQAVHLELPVLIGRAYYVATDTDPLGALAALISYSSQTLVIQVPDHVADILGDEAEDPAIWADDDVPRDH